MASALTDRLSQLVKSLRGQARITESNVQDMLREIRMALLEADVALPVVREFIARVKDKALGQEVVGSLNPGQALVGIVHKDRIEVGDPARTILRVADEEACDLVLLGEAPASGLQRWLPRAMGLSVVTVASEVTQLAPVPVVIVK